MTIGEQQLEELVSKELLPRGRNKFKLNRGTVANPRLVKGIELLNTRSEWAISFFRNVNNPNNDVEVAIAPARIAHEGMAGAAMRWLESARSELDHCDHKPHPGRYLGPVFRIGLKVPDLEAFLQRFMAEILKGPSQSPWTVSADETAEATVKPAAPALEPLIHEDFRARSIAHMVGMAFSAHDQSGLERVSLNKDKKILFDSAEHLHAHLEGLWMSEYCSLSGLKMDMSGEDPDLAPSLDRIDSDKHYEPGNLQIVARFVNRWKSDDKQDNFVRLLELVRSPPAGRASPGTGAFVPRYNTQVHSDTGR